MTKKKKPAKRKQLVLGRDFDAWASKTSKSGWARLSEKPVLSMTRYEANLFGKPVRVKFVELE